MAMLRATLSAIPDFYHCMSPSCPSGQIHEDAENNPIFTCNSCRNRYCITCKTPWHGDISCEMFRRGEQRKEAEDGERKELKTRKQAEEKATEAALRKVTKDCPGCGCKIEKIADGCDIMNCEIFALFFPLPLSSHVHFLFQSTYLSYLADAKRFPFLRL